MESLPFQYQKRPYWEFYCPVCKKERRSFYWPSPRRRHYFQLAVLGLFITLCLWPLVGFKGLFVNVLLWAIFEFAYRARARQSLVCPYCAFDPYLYKHDVKLARKKVEQHFASRRAALEKAGRLGERPKKDTPPTKY